MGIFTADNTFKPRARKADGQVSRLKTKWQPRFIQLSFQAGATQGSFFVNLMPSQAKRVFSCILEMCNAQAETNYVLEIDKANQLDAKVEIGRDADGLIYLQFTKQGFDPAKYVFLPERQYRWHKDGQRLPSNEDSRREAREYAEGMKYQLDKRMGEITEADSEAANQKFGGGNKKPYGGGGNQGGQNHAPAAPVNFDEFVG